MHLRGSLPQFAILAGLLALVGASATVHHVAGQTTTTDEIWRGCSARELRGTVREVRCPGFRLRLLRAPTMATPEGLRVGAEGIGGAGGLTQARAGTMTVGARTVPTLDIPGAFLAVPRQYTVAVCMEPAGERRERCLVAIRWMVRTRELPPGVSFPEPPDIFGVPVVTPPGCHLRGGEMIVCDSGQFSWRTVQGSRASAADEMRRVLPILRRQLTVVSESDVTCSVRGTPGTGRRLAVQVQGQAVDVIVCVAERDGQTVLTQCTGRIPPGRSYPPQCAQAMDSPAP